VSVAPSATPLLTSSAIESLRDAGVEAISLSLDGSAAERHDAIRGIPGTYDRTLEAARAAFACGLPFQVNTLVCGETVDDLPAIYETVVARGAARWSLFFLVSVGRGHVLAPISSSQAERVLTWAAALNTSPDLHRPIVTTTEAPHFRRVTAERRRERPAAAASPAASPHGRRGGGIRDGNGIMFISHTGQITPSGFLEVPCGNVRRDNVIEVYQRSELFVQLREPTAFGGRCGRCAFQWICGGSRARAFAATGDPLAEDPLCDYQPAHAPRSRMAMA
jgi:radical SAM protein with 4Fe4S-binding SPASM domain